MATSDAPIHTSEELSKRQTELSFHRTRLSADRTLMSVIRTALSLISFGFTINQVLEKLPDTALVRHAPNAGRNFSLALILLGVGSLILGIVYHSFFMRGLRRERSALIDESLMHGDSGFPISMTLIVAICLVLIGLLAIVSIGFHAGPFG